MEKDSKKPILNFEPGSRQPFILYLISITIISAIVVIVCLFTSGLSFSEEKAKEIGDVNLDGIVDSKDVLLLSQHLTGKIRLDEAQLAVADVDNNGEINSKDSMLIIQLQSKTTENQSPTVPTTITNEPSTQSDDSAADDTTNEPTSEESTSPEVDVDFVLSGKADGMAFLTGENGVYYSARMVNNWISSEGKYMYQLEFTVKNNSDKTVYNTSADINFSDSVSTEKNWDCSITDEGSTVSVKTQNQGRVKPGGTFRCGFIISAGCPITVNSITK